jgi:hypothetical protein
VRACDEGRRKEKGGEKRRAAKREGRRKEKGGEKRRAANRDRDTRAEGGGLLGALDGGNDEALAGTTFDGLEDAARGGLAFQTTSGWAKGGIWYRTNMIWGSHIIETTKGGVELSRRPGRRDDDQQLREEVREAVESWVQRQTTVMIRRG